MKVRRLSQDVLGILSTRVAWTVMSLVTGLILARKLGPSDRGVLALVLLGSSTVVTFVKLGISQANVYLVRRRRESVARVASNCISLALVLGAVSVAVTWSMRSTLFTTVMRGVAPWALALGLVRVPLLLIDDYLYGVLQAEGQFQLYNRRLILSEALRLVLVIAALLVFKLGLAAAVSIYTFVTIFNVTWLVISTRRLIPFSVGWDLRLLREQLAFGVKSYVQTLTSHAILRVDVYMVSFFKKDTAEVAYYSLALRFTEMILELPQAVGLVLYPRLASVPVKEIYPLTAQAVRRLLLPSGIAVGLLALVGPRLITLWYGQDYAAAGAPLPWAAVGVLAMSVFVILSRAFTSQNRQQVNIVAGLVALGLEVGLNVVMIPRYGIVGAAIATALSYAGACAVLMAVFVRASNIPMTALLVARREDIGFLWQTLRQMVRSGARLAGWKSFGAGK